MFFTPDDYFRKLFERSRRIDGIVGFGSAVQNVPPTKEGQLICLNDHIKNLENFKLMLDCEIKATQHAITEIGKMDD